jgi:hypothetical protein
MHQQPNGQGLVPRRGAVAAFIRNCGEELRDLV